MVNYSNIRVLALAVIAFPLFMLTSCTEQKKGPDVTVNIGPLMSLDSQDTIIVDQLSTEFIEHLKNKEYADAISMLYYLDPDSALIPLPRNLALRQEQIFRMFPVLDYKYESRRFRTESDCQVKFVITFSEKKGPDDKADYTTSLYLQPVRREGQWYLTVRDSSSPAGSVSKIQN
jgi:hypothetical protein